jgi:hypothetical protein
MLSPRIRKFHSLVRAAYDQSSPWLTAVLKNPDVPVLSRLACLRILTCRHPGGLPYPQRKQAVRKELGV